MAEFDLYQLVAQISQDPSFNTPREIARRVKQHIPVQSYGSALESTLTGYVRSYLGQVRSGKPTWRERADDKSVAGAKNSARSHRVALIRESYKLMLDGRYHVGPDNWKMLRNCNADDVISIASERQRIADNCTLSAKRFRKLAELLTTHGCDKVGDLPEEALVDFLTEDSVTDPS